MEKAGVDCFQHCSFVVGFQSCRSRKSLRTNRDDMECYLTPQHSPVNILQLPLAHTTRMQVPIARSF